MLVPRCQCSRHDVNSSPRRLDLLLSGRLVGGTAPEPGGAGWRLGVLIWTPVMMALMRAGASLVAGGPMPARGERPGDWSGGGCPNRLLLVLISPGGGRRVAASAGWGVPGSASVAGWARRPDCGGRGAGGRRLDAKAAVPFSLAARDDRGRLPMRSTVCPAASRRCCGGCRWSW